MSDMGLLNPKPQPPTPPAPAPLLLTASDRCDRCGAQAQMKVVMPSGYDLMLCRHHGNEHLPALVEAGATVEANANQETM